LESKQNIFNQGKPYHKVIYITFQARFAIKFLVTNVSNVFLFNFYFRMLDHVLSLFDRDDDISVVAIGIINNMALNKQ